MSKKSNRMNLCLTWRYSFRMPLAGIVSSEDWTSLCIVFALCLVDYYLLGLL